MVFLVGFYPELCNIKTGRCRLYTLIYDRTISDIKDMGILTHFDWVDSLYRCTLVQQHCVIISYRSRIPMG